MSSIKITPIFLFLLLLIVLVISFVYGNRLLSKEGFVSFQQSKNPLDALLIPSYSTINYNTKLYDSLYFDYTNGNLIEVDATRFSGNIDATGVSIATTNVIPRINSNNAYTFKNVLNGTTVVPQDTQPSLIPYVMPSYSSYVYPTQSVNTDKYTVFYFPWNTETYIHIINNSTRSNVATYYFNDNGDIQTFNFANEPIGLNGINPTADPITPNNSIPTVDTLYDGSRQLYQISSSVKFDIANGNLILQTPSETTTSPRSISIFNRYSSSGSSPPIVVNEVGKNVVTENTVSNVSFTPYVVINDVGKDMVLYIPYKKNTVVALIGYSDSNMQSYTLKNVVRFTSTTVDLGTTNTPTVNTFSGTSAGTSFPMAPPTKDSAMSEYFKWYWYWKNSGQPSNFNYSDDYLLKTQIVPPVCPACPACSGGACTNCGGKGGSGTLSQNGNTVVGGNTVNSQTTQGRLVTPGTGPANNLSVIGNGAFVSNANPDTIGGSLTLTTYDTVAGIQGVAQTGADVLNKTAGAVGSVANKALDTVGGVVGTAGGVVKDLSKDVTGLVGGAGTGVKDVLTNNNRYGYDNTRTIGPNGKPVPINRTEGAFNSPYGTSTRDQYSYYGALPSKGDSNFMPVTADFSAFGL